MDAGGSWAVRIEGEPLDAGAPQTCLFCANPLQSVSLTFSFLGSETVPRLADQLLRQRRTARVAHSGQRAERRGSCRRFPSSAQKLTLALGRESMDRSTLKA